MLSAIFARKNKENDDYVNDCKSKEEANQAKSDVPLMITDKIIDIWDSVFPQRQIIFQDAKVKAKTKETSEYMAKYMSDGERVAIYLIGQCLIAPDGIKLVIDEPEIHLHKSIMHRLWDKIEQHCPNKTFVYITHDLDFASSRKDSTKIWVKSFKKEGSSEKWDIQVLEDNDNIPDSLMIEVLGNRKNVLFVEGEKGSYDNQLYPYIYDNYYVIPCHNCAKVIEMTKAFNEEKVKGLHDVSVKGLIDRDYMTPNEIESYKGCNIFTLDVAEVENLYLVEAIQRIVAENQAIDNIDKTLADVKEFIFSEFNKEKELQITRMCEREIRYKLRNFSKNGNTLESLKDKFQETMDNINIDEIYRVSTEKINNILKSNDLNELLKIYNNKGLIARVSKFFNVTDYSKLVLRLLKTDKKHAIIDDLKAFTPEID